MLHVVETMQYVVEADLDLDHEIKHSKLTDQ